MIMMDHMRGHLRNRYSVTIIQAFLDGDGEKFETMTSTLPLGTLGSATIYQGNPDRKHTLMNIV
jgi:hypothetical protein